jgi:hypothetical protein
MKEDCKSLINGMLTLDPNKRFSINKAFFLGKKIAKGRHLDKLIYLTKKNIIGYRNIYLICNDPNILIEGCITINENIFPFSIESINKMYGELNRNNWYLQQLLKLYSLITIPGIKDNCLIIDADTFFLKPTKFIRNNKCLYNFGNEYHRPYFEHMSRLDDDLIIDFKLTFCMFLNLIW